MSEVAAEAATEAQAAENDQQDQNDEKPAKDWRDDFDADRAQKTIERLRDELKAAKADKEPQADKDKKAITALRKQLAELEGKAQSADEKDQTLSKLQRELLYERTARQVGLGEDLFDLLRGDTPEEVLNVAQKLVDLKAGKNNPPASRRPEALRGGSDPSKPVEETDPGKLAAAARARSQFGSALR